MAQEKPLVLLDFETNEDINDLSEPLSHASLIKRYLQDEWYVHLHRHSLITVLPWQPTHWLALYLRIEEVPAFPKDYHATAPSDQSSNTASTDQKETRKQRNKRIDTKKTARGQRGPVVEGGGGFGLLDKVKYEDGRTDVALYSESGIKFSERALDPRAKLILRKNYKQNARLRNPNVHKYADDDDDEEDRKVEEEDDTRQYVRKAGEKQRAASLAEFMTVGQRKGHTAAAAAAALQRLQEEEEEAERRMLEEALGGHTADSAKEWACLRCTYWNKSSFLCCEMCQSERPTTL